MSSPGQLSRPGVLDNTTSTQLDELARVINGGDQQYYNQLIQSYGWDQKTGQQVWQFMTHRVTQSEIEQAFSKENEPGRASSS